MGYDLYSTENKEVKAFGCELINTDVAINIPKGTYGRIAPRSSVAYKHLINFGAGVAEYDYRGKIVVVLFNPFSKPFKGEVGDRIAQIILKKMKIAEVIEVEELAYTGRGHNGFGSTGKN